MQADRLILQHTSDFVEPAREMLGKKLLQFRPVFRSGPLDVNNRDRLWLERGGSKGETSSPPLILENEPSALFVEFS